MMQALQSGGACICCGSLSAEILRPQPCVPKRTGLHHQVGINAAKHSLHRHVLEGRRTIIRCDATPGLVSDADVIEAINEVSISTLRAMLANDKRAAAVRADLQDMLDQSLEYGESESAVFLRVLDGMLDHRIIADAEHLEGLYAQAFNRICNQVAGSDWKLTQDGQPEMPEEPQFSTWEEALGGRRQHSSQPSSSASSNGSDGNTGTNATSSRTSVKDDTYYRVLEVAATASPPEIKAAFRKMALKLHPDVNSAPDAEQRFMQLSQAYDVLSDAESRRLYDRYGAEGMKQHQGSASGRGNARDFWEEFKPFKRENKRTKARDAAAAAAAADVSGTDAAEAVAGSALHGFGREPPGSETAQLRQPETGDVVEYPLSDVVRQELQDGRSHGVALLVGRNIDRGDAGKLPEDVLDLCEVEPLRQEESESAVWIPDELQPSAYVRLGELRIVPIAAFDRRFDAWTIEAPLSEGCGGPDLPEEVML